MDKFILITGGTKGIGKAVASCLGKAGYNLILTYASDQAAAEEVRSELVGRFDIQVSILRADISDRNTIGVIDSFLEENRLRLDGSHAAALGHYRVYGYIRGLGPGFLC